MVATVVVTLAGPSVSSCRTGQNRPERARTDYFQALNQHLDLAKASQVPRWRQSEVFTPLERDVLEYAEAMTDTPPTVTDELSKSLLDRLGPAALVELTVFIGFANLATRCNMAHGITSQGYSDACEIPLATRPQDSGVTSTA